MKNESTSLVRQIKNTSWDERERKSERKRERESERERETWYNPRCFFLVFCCISRMCFLAGTVFTAWRRVWDSFVELTQKWRPWFSDVITLSSLVYNWTPFPVSYTESSPPTAFHFQFLQATQNTSPSCWWYISLSNQGVRCHFYQEISIHFCFIAFLSFYHSHIYSFLFHHPVVD